jgi:short-subunit dehydrogenase
MAVHLKPVEEQVVVITGASSGIGLATARMFAERGARGLVLVARNAESLNDLARELNARGTRTIAVPADTAKREDLERIAGTAVETFGGFDTWVNDAAVAMYGTLEEIPIEDQRHQFEVNYWGVVNGSLIAARHLRQHGGAIINLGSVVSERAMLFQTQYSATKHAVKAFTDGLRMELEREGAPISVTLIKPSAIDTPYPEHARNYLADNPSLPPPSYDPHLVAKAIVFAAEHQKRDLTVGLGGWMIGALGTLAPRLTDFVMELMGYRMQTTREPERQSMRDNLYRPRQDGDEYSSLSGEPRRTSLFLAAQMHPLATAAVLAGIGAAVAAFLIPRESRSRPGRRAAPATPARRYEQVTTKKSGNGHSEYVVGPGYRARHEPFQGRPQPRH